MNAAIIKKSVNTDRSSLSLTSLLSSVSSILSCPGTTVLLLEVVPEHHILGQHKGSAVSPVFGYAIIFYPSARWRPCCWQQSDRKAGCHSGGPLGWQGPSAAAQIGAPPSSGWCCCDTGRSPPFWSETDKKNTGWRINLQKSYHLQYHQYDYLEFHFFINQSTEI